MVSTLLALLLWGAPGAAYAAGAQGAPKHPTLFLTPEAVRHGRDNVRRYDWARGIAGAVVREADRWLARDDDWLRRAVPPAGSVYAYGLSGCPVCGAFWGPFGRGAGSWEHPRTVICPNGHRTPDAAHADSGSGYHATDGRIHYPVAVYNSWAIETLTFSALENLVHAYTLTGDERYAAKAAVLLDAVAAVYPAAHSGCQDYPSDPPSGRLNRPWYQASRVLIHFADQYDQLFSSPALDQPSTVAGLTRRRNIEDHLLKDGGEYCFRESHAGRLTNGEADYLRGVLAVGVCLGIPEYVDWAVDGPFGIRVLAANDIGRDGTYYEVTPMYSDHTRELWFTFAEPLRNSGHPFDLYSVPNFQRFLLPYNLQLRLAGVMPRYGDAPPDRQRHVSESRPFDRSDYDFLEKLWTRTGIGGDLLAWLANGLFANLRGLSSTGDAGSIPDRRVAVGMSIYREPGDTLGGAFSDRIWMLFHAGEPPATKDAPDAAWLRRLQGCDFYGQKGVAVLRNGAQGVLLRYGPSMTHGHYDDLNVNYSARGYDLSHDLGYGVTAATQTQAGWARQTASHNLVVVDETSQGEDGASGGSLHLFVDAPLVKAAEASSENSYARRGVTVYRRLAALIGSGEDAYLLDIFRVRGGSRHDWVWHSMSAEAALSGVTLGPPEPGSLAGPDVCWSASQLADGDMAGHPGAPFWIPPPGNGYGFLCGARRGRPAGEWSADWALDSANRVRVHLAAQPGTEAVAALANGLYPQYPKSQYVLSRRAGEHLASEFVAAVEPYGNTPGIVAVERLPFGPAAEIVPVAVKVIRRDGTIDYVFSAADDAPRETAGMLFAGRFLHVRVRNGKVVALAAAGLKQFSGLGLKLAPETPSWNGTVKAVDAEHGVLTVDVPLPAALSGSVIIVRGEGYSRSTAYRVARINGHTIKLEESARLGMGRVVSATGNVLTTMTPHEYMNSTRGMGRSGFFSGKLVRARSGATARIRAVAYGLPVKLTVSSTAGFQPGEEFWYEDIAVGDRFEILVNMRR